MASSPAAAKAAVLQLPVTEHATRGKLVHTLLCKLVRPLKPPPKALRGAQLVFPGVIPGTVSLPVGASIEAREQVFNTHSAAAALQETRNICRVGLAR